jgi:peptide/nickel transport system substrate-binding protein
MGCDKAWFGWPCDAKFEELRKAWAFASADDERKRLVVELSKRAYEQVPYITFGQWVNPVAYRSDRISGVLPVPSVPPMWNIEKK